MDRQPIVVIERPRSASELISATFELYRAFPFLFLIFAAAVVVPYQLIVLAITGTGPFTAQSMGFVESQIVSITSLVLVGPLISALHVHAVNDVNEGGLPKIGSVARRSLATLPVVVAAVIISWLGILAGFVALIVPGILLSLRWSVAAQAAALEDGGWIDALKRSTELAYRNREHIFGVLFLAGLIGAIPGIPLLLVFRHTETTAVSFLIGTAFQVLVHSFTALVAALLYFDLRSRLRFARDHPLGAPVRPAVEPTGHPLDPDSYTNADRPHGWFVDPSHPEQMRYWSGHDRLGWTPNPQRTPKKTLADWQTYKVANPGPPPTPAPSSAASEPPVVPTGHPLDPDSYNDADRPPGWYVIPETPWKMRYWLGEGVAMGWSSRTARTPKQTQAGWYKVNDR